MPFHPHFMAPTPVLRHNEGLDFSSRPLHRLLALAACVWLLFCAAPASAQNSLEETTRQMFRKQVENLRTSASRMRKLDKHHFEDLFQLKVEDGTLTLRTTLSSCAQVACDIDGPDAVTTLQITGGDDGHRPGGVVPRNFQLTSVRYADGKLHTLRISAQPDVVQLSEQEQGVNTFQSAQVQQSSRLMRNDGDDGNSVLLTFGRNGTSIAPLNVRVTAADFADLLKTHRAEVNSYARPLLFQIGQEAVFGGDSALITQVFSELWKSDPRMAGEITKRLPDLDADDYRTREKALNELRRLGREVAVEAMHTDRTRLSAEQTMRLDSLVAQYFTTPRGELESLRRDPSFLLDCLYVEDPAVTRAAVAHLQAAMGRKIDFDAKTTGHDRLTAVRALREALMPEPATRP